MSLKLGAVSFFYFRIATLLDLSKSDNSVVWKVDIIRFNWLNGAKSEIEPKLNYTKRLPYSLKCNIKFNSITGSWRVE